MAGYQCEEMILKKNRLDQLRIKNLEALPGWTWDRAGDAFNLGFDKLLSYVNTYGISTVSKSYVDSDGFKLGQWVKNRKNDYINKKLSVDRIKKFESLAGWDWS